MLERLNEFLAYLRSLSWEQSLLLGGSVFVVSFLLSLAITVAVVLRIPANYFRDDVAPTPLPHPVIHGLLFLGRNLLGALIVLIGVVLSLPGVPGQGLLTILIGLMLLDFPGKRRLEKRLVRRPMVRNSINRLRLRFDRPPLDLDESEPVDPPGAPWTAREIAAVVVAVLLAAGILTLEMRVGPGYAVLAFYVVPFFLAAWYGGRTVAFGLAGVTALAWLVVGLIDDTQGELLVAWNALVRLGLFVAVCWIASSLREAFHRELELARADALTGVANVKHFTELADREIARAHRNQQPFTVAYVDVDDFRGINTRFGHAAGDTLLRDVAQAIRACVRETDTLARLGGDEFILLLPETGLEAAQAACRKVHQNLADLAAAREWPVGFTLGVVTCLQPPACTPRELIKLADDLMAGAKKEGKNRIKHDVLIQPSPQPVRTI